MARAKVTYKDKSGKIRTQRQRTVVTLDNEFPEPTVSWPTFPRPPRMWKAPKFLNLPSTALPIIDRGPRISGPPEFLKLLELMQIAGLADRRKPLLILSAPAYNAASDLIKILKTSWIEPTPRPDIRKTLFQMQDLEGDELRHAIDVADFLTRITLNDAARKYCESLAGKDAKLPAEWYDPSLTNCLSALILLGISDDELHKIIRMGRAILPKGPGRYDLSHQDDILIARLMNWWRTYVGEEPQIKLKSRFIQFCEMILVARVGIQTYPKRVVEIVRHAKKAIADDPLLFSNLFPTVEPFKP